MPSDGSTETGRSEGHGETDQVLVVPGGRGKLHWLDKRGPSLVYDVRDKLIAALDIDGTLAKDYMMERFLEHLRGNDDFMRLINSLPSRNKNVEDVIEYVKRKESATRLSIETKLITQLESASGPDPFAAIGGYRPFLINLVLEMFEAVKNNKERNPNKDPYEEFGGYEKFIEQTAKFYAFITQGTDFETMLKFGKAFFVKYLEDGNIFSHTRPLIKLYQDVGIEVCLITGAPRELVEPFREYFHIAPTGEALECNRDEKGVNDKGKIKYNSGRPKVKAKVIRLMQAAGHRIVIAAGDSISADGQMITSAIFPSAGTPNDIFGAGLFFVSAEKTKAFTDAKVHFTDAIATGRLKIIHLEDLGCEAIIADARHQLLDILGMPANQGRIPPSVQEKILREVGIPNQQLDIPLLDIDGK